MPTFSWQDHRTTPGACWTTLREGIWLADVPSWRECRSDRIELHLVRSWVSQPTASSGCRLATRTLSHCFSPGAAARECASLRFAETTRRHAEGFTPQRYTCISWQARLLVQCHFVRRFVVTLWQPLSTLDHESNLSEVIQGRGIHVSDACKPCHVRLADQQTSGKYGL